MAKSEYCNYILDLLSPLGSVTARSMFGGYGVYNNGIIFAIIVEEVLYFKTDDTNRHDYENKHSEPFSYEAKDKKNIVMSYWQVPLDILDDNELLCQWADKSYNISKNNQKPKKKPAKKPNPNRPVKNMYGLGPKSSEWLKEIGIETEGQLRSLGAVSTYKRLTKWNPKLVNLNMLWGLYAAIEGIHWKNIDKETKSQLLLEIGNLQKRKSTT